MKSKNQMGKCALCQKPNVKLAHSHIVPEFAYADFYDEKHRLRTFEGDGTAQDPKWFQKGFREYLLCGGDDSLLGSCEGKLAKWESHAASVIGPKCVNSLTVPQQDSIEVSIKYAEFKLYGMSLIWRLAATSLPNFAIGSLGKLQEELRLALNSSDPQEPDRFPCYIRAFIAPDGNFYSDWMHTPFTHQFFGKCAVSMVICGFVYTFVAKAPQVTTELLSASANLSGALRIPVSPISEWPELESFYNITVLAAKRHAEQRGRDS